MSTPASEYEVDFELKERAMDEAPVGITITDPSLDDNPLVYVNESFVRMTGYPREEVLGRNCRFLQGEASDPEAIATLREAIDREEPVTVELLNYRADGETFWNEVTVAPIRNPAGEVTNFVGFQADVTARKEAEFEVERERRNLDHLLSRIQGLIGDVTRELVEGSGRDEIERAVCERIVETESYAFAWIGRADRASDTLSPAAWAGDPGVSVADLAIDLERDDHPVADAVETRSVQVRGGGAGGMEAPWRTDGFEGVAAIPLAYGDTLYGVLTVYATREDALDERETAVLEALGRATATSINALESRRILSADNVTELEFEIRDPGLFVAALSAQFDCQLEFRGSVYRSEGALSMFFTTDGDPEAILDGAADLPEITDAAVVSHGDRESLVEFRVADGSIVTDLAERGVRTRGITADGGAARVLLELPAGADSRAIADRVRERYPESELVAYRERERPPITKGEFIAGLEDRLTDRQLTALQTAFVSGFYEWNRPTSGDELAESMGISRSTFHQHLRAAERKLVAEFFDQRIPYQ